jgi:BirA family transcriptional regulator, biotin operon repressor / biotin---[acetyl-CoA-carboxylase] ligase
MIELDTRRLVDAFTTLESVAVIPRVASTNMVARRIVSECIANEVSLPQGIIIAGEQFAGIGRNARRWSSPARKGIYATTLLTVAPEELPLVPLAMANIVASFVRETYGIDARIKWPNDVLVQRRKIAGILIEARTHEERVYVVIGTGVNVEPASDDDRPNAISIAEAAPESFKGIADATERFILFVDKKLGLRFDRTKVLQEWRSMSVHTEGESIECVLHDRTVRGTWAGIDDHGRALLRSGDETLAVSAGDLILS